MFNVHLPHEIKRKLLIKAEGFFFFMRGGKLIQIEWSRLIGRGPPINYRSLTEEILAYQPACAIN